MNRYLRVNSVLPFVDFEENLKYFLYFRTKALKCMAMIVAEDPEVLLRHDMQTGVQVTSDI